MNECPFRKPKLRPELPPLPLRIASLPIDERGYPIPFFVAFIDGKPDFRIADGEKHSRCVHYGLCWVCGGLMSAHKAFVIGPMCAINRVSGDPPSHTECALWSVKGCPFLTRPKMVRREDELSESGKVNVAGVMIERNPGVSLVWVTKNYKLFRDHKGKALFDIGDPVSTSWWREGRTATRDEVMESIDSGLPLLLEANDKEPTPQRQFDGRMEIERRRKQVIDKLVPC